ncbi:hypothetical protein HanIR_Chr10g0494071 [Helianthus annuus]|nr:hypothetical protein HanIR_Chr10g0494071 [Helianthus annuus]
MVVCSFSMLSADIGASCGRALSRRRAGKWCSSREARDRKFIRIRSMVPRAPLMEVCAAFWDHTPSEMRHF